MKKTKNITESQNINSIDIDTKNISEIIKIFNHDNKDIIDGISNSSVDIKNIVRGFRNSISLFSKALIQFVFNRIMLNQFFHFFGIFGK